MALVYTCEHGLHSLLICGACQAGVRQASIERLREFFAAISPSERARLFKMFGEQLEAKPDRAAGATNGK